MRGAVLHELRAPLRVESALRIPPLRPGQVLVRMAYSGVCHSQLMEARGERGVDPHLPHLLGHEGSGVAVEVGSSVTKVRPGDRVVLSWIRGSGIDEGGSIYQRGELAINAGPVTTFNEYAVVSENRCTPLPPHVPMDVAVLLGCAFPTGGGIVLNCIRPKAGASVAVYGLGGVGLCALTALRLFDCSEVIAVDVSLDKLEVAQELGATHCVNAAEEEPVKTVLEITRGRGVDFSLEAAGLSRTIEQAFQSVRRNGGVCVFASHPSAGSRIQLDPYDFICGRELKGSWGGASNMDSDVPKYARLFQERRLPLGRILTRGYRLETVSDALSDLESGRAFRPLVEIDATVGAG